MKNKIRLSVIIVNHNGAKYAIRCVDSILKAKPQDTEIILVDNGSKKSDLMMIKKRFSKIIQIVTLKMNYGPAYARNQGVKVSSGEYLGFLDNDTEVHQKWAITAIREFDEDNFLGIIQCKLLLLSDHKKIDYVGEYLGQNGFLVQRAKSGESDTGKYDQKVELLAAKSAGMFIRRRAFLEAGGFDNDYFIYVEETDLGWRSWLKGYRTIFLPTSIVYHEFGTSTIILGKKQNTYNAKFHGSKNYILTLLKNLGSKSLFSILPIHVVLWIGLSFFVLFRRDYKSAAWILKGIGWNLLHLGETLQKRRLIQQSRTKSDVELFPIILKKKPFSYFLYKATNKHTVGNAESF